MFENIIGHQNTITQLKKDIDQEMLPPSLLFTGEPFTGKMTTALELARVLSCRKNGAWGCSCSSCTKHRLLESGNTVILTTRSFLREIKVCGDTLMRTMSIPARFMYIRAVRKLIHKFDDVLWRNEDQKIKKLNPSLEKLEDTLEPVFTNEKLPEKDKLEKILSSVEKIVEGIENTVKSDGIPVHQIRNVTYWVHTTNNENSKIVILDNVDRLGEGSRNALLKVLEETPPSVYFILLSSRREGIIPTILSRVRTYSFASRSQAVESEVIKRIFREKEDFTGSLERYFLYKNNVNEELLHEYAVQVISSVVRTRAGDTARLETVIASVVKDNLFIPFLHEIVRVLQNILYEEMDPATNVSVATLAAWYAALNEVLKNRESYNQNPSLLLSSLFTTMRENAR